MGGRMFHQVISVFIYRPSAYRMRPSSIQSRIMIGEEFTNKLLLIGKMFVIRKKEKKKDVERITFALTAINIF